MGRSFLSGFSLLLILASIHVSEALPTTATSDGWNIELEEIIEGGHCRSVAVSGTIVCAGFDELVTIFDITDPSHPVKLANLPLSSTAWEIKLKGDYAYVLAGGAIWVIDISDPSTPLVAGSETGGTGGTDLTIAGDYLYHAQDEYGLRILDISSPTNPVQVGFYQTGVWDVAVQGDYAYVADFGLGVQILDVSDPTQPTYVAMAQTGDRPTIVDVLGNYVYASTWFAPMFWVIDVADPTLPAVVGQLGGLEGNSDLAVQGSYVYLTSYTHEGLLSVIDVSTPTAPFLAGSTFVGDSDKLALLGDVVAVAAKRSGMRMVDISEPVDPSVVGGHDTIGYVYHVALAGDYLAFTNIGAYLLLMNMADTEDRYYAGGTVARGNAEPNDIITEGSYAYATYCDSWYQIDSGFQIIDVSDPTNATEVGFLRMRCPAPLGVEGDLAFVGTLDGFITMDVSNPTNPTALDTSDAVGWGYAICASGTHAYVVDGDNGLIILDASDPSSPVVVGSHVFDGTARDVAVFGDHAFVAGNDHAEAIGLWVVDISNPAAPTVVGEFVTNSVTTHLSIRDDYAYLSSYYGLRLFMVDISDPTNPTEAGYIDAYEIPWRVVVEPPRIYAISDTPEGLLVFWSDVLATGVQQFSMFRATELDQNYPNPFNPSTTIAFTVPTRTHVNLSIYDVQGKLVATLVDERFPSGPNEVRWDGRDSKGNAVSSGVYFYRLVAGGQVLTKKMVVLR